MNLYMFSAEDIERLLSMPDAIEVNTRAYIALSQSASVTPQRLAIETDRGVSLFMPSYVLTSGDLALKVVSVFPDNSRRGLPTIQALVLLLEAETGRPLACLDGTRLTALRTGAGVGAATRALAREDSHVLALFGAGGQAPDQIEAVLAVRPIREVRIYTPSGDSAERLAHRMAARHPDVTFRRVATPEDAVRDADIITCVTTSSTPVFDPEDVAPGTHINGVGSFTPTMREVQLVGLAPLRVFVDSLEAARAEAGDVIQAVAEGYLRWEDVEEIGRVLVGEVPGRDSREDITFFKSVGVAVQDAMTAGEIVRRGRTMHRG